jgi:hypothetical protein
MSDLQVIADRVEIEALRAGYTGAVVMRAAVPRLAYGPACTERMRQMPMP